MSIQSVGTTSYGDALAAFQQSQRTFNTTQANIVNAEPPQVSSFGETLNASLQELNDLQDEKAMAITSFAAGETQNVHELMISMQKASVAVSLTAAVRNKALEAYRELSGLQF